MPGTRQSLQASNHPLWAHCYTPSTVKVNYTSTLLSYEAALLFTTAPYNDNFPPPIVLEYKINKFLVSLQSTHKCNAVFYIKWPFIKL